MLYKLMELASDPLGSGLTFLQQGVLVVQAEDLQLLRQLLGGHGHGDPGEVGPGSELTQLESTPAEAYPFALREGDRNASRDHLA